MNKISLITRQNYRQTTRFVKAYAHQWVLWAFRLDLDDVSILLTMIKR